MKKKASTAKRPVNYARRQARESHSRALRGRFQAIVNEAVSPHVLLAEIWNSTDANLDQLVDEYAASHYADGYRKAELQYRNTHKLLDTVREDNARQLYEHMYSRFLLAADVGFELGFAAAQSLGGRR